MNVILPSRRLKWLLTILFPLIAFMAHAQTQTIKGRVLDESGTGLPGVSVYLKGTSNGTVTDVDGNFSLGSVESSSTLVASYIGYTAQEVAVGNKTTFTITLRPDENKLSEVVVVGYGTQKKSDLTGAVVSANLEAFKEAPNTNILQSLQGSLPGVQIGQIKSAGEEPSIQVRGRATLSGSQSPLIILDGTIYRGRISDINPSDIASIDVLKDPSSKAVYGAQAANGVVLITSKNGRGAKKPTINYSVSYATQSPNTEVRLLNREEVLQKIKDVEYTKAYLAPDYTTPNPAYSFENSELFPAHLKGIEEGLDVDWWGEATSPGYIADHNLSLSGGSEATTYFVSGGYTDQEGYIKNDKFSRASIRINLQTEVNKWLTVGTNTFASFSDRSGVSPNMNDLANTSPLVPIRDGNGNYIINHLQDLNTNPFLDYAADDVDKNNNISGNFFAIVNVPGVEGLTYRLNYNSTYRSVYQARSNRYGAGLTGEAYKNNNSTTEMLLDNIVNYDRNFGDHGINATLVAGVNETEFESTNARTINIDDLSLSYNSLGQGLTPTVGSGAWSQFQSYQMGRLSYNFKSRYLITGTLRRDAYSGFSKNNKSALFPSLGLGWVLSEESFFKVPAVDFLKFRASYGVNGNLTDRYSSLAKVRANNSLKYVYGDGAQTSVGYSIETMANPNLGWEKTTGFNFGLDFELLSNRISGSVDYYNNTTKDLLWDKRIPEITGFNQIRDNLGEIHNQGLEFILSGTPISSGDFTWNISTNFSRNRNKIVKLLGLDADGDGNEDDLISSGLFIGRPIETIYNYEIDGIWQVSEEIPEGFQPGTYRVVDQNGDGKIDPQNDRVFLGNREEAFRFGIQNTVQYKDFTLRFFINSVQGGENSYLKDNHPYLGFLGSTGTAQNWNWYNNWNYWSPTNPGADYPQPWIPAAIRPVRYLSRSFTRLQDVSLSYNIRSSFIEKMGIGSAKVFVSGKNLITLTDWKGWDPETGDGIGNDQGLPVMKAYSVGFDISF